MPEYSYACQSPKCGVVTEVFMGMHEQHPEHRKCPTCGKRAIRSVGDDGRRSSRVNFTPYYEPQLGAIVTSSKHIDRICTNRGLTVLGADERFTSPDSYHASEAEIRECKERAQSSGLPRIYERPVEGVRRVNLGD